MFFGAKRLAITGGPGEGKSTVLGYVGESGVATASADDFAKELWESPSMQKEVSALLGLPAPVSRDAVRAAMLDSPEIRRRLNRLFHRTILDRILAHPAQVIEVPLLFEACLHPLFSKVWVVTCGGEEQLHRLAIRFGDEDVARRMAGSQLPTRVKHAFADRIVRTNQPKPSVRAYVLEALVVDFG